MAITATAIGTAIGATGTTATVVGAAIGAVGITAVGAAVGSALSPKLPGQPDVSAPQLPNVPVMPTPDSTAVQQARQLSIAQQMQAQGRAATVLTQQNNSGSGKLGA